MNDIISQFQKNVAKWPENIAVEEGHNKYTYRELNNYANFITTLLPKTNGQTKQVYAIVGKRSFEMVAAIIAVLKSNNTYLPLDLTLPDSLLTKILTNTQVNAILFRHNERLPSAFNETKQIPLDYSQYNPTITYDDLNYPISPNDPAYIMHTSGSTGTPKSVVVPHRAVIRLLVNPNYITINANDVVLFHSNTTFDAAIFEIWAAMLNGAKLVIYPGTTGDLLAIFSLCMQSKVTILLLTTGLFHAFSNMNVENLTSLRYLVVGGDVMHSSAARRIMQRNKSLIMINGYGPAENAVFSTCLVIKSEQDITDPVSIGSPISGTDVYLLDENFKEVAEGEIGEIFVGGTGLALGYINAPEMTASRFLRIPTIGKNTLLYRTSDLAKKLLNNNYQFIGRRDYQVKIRDHQVDLSEIESVISSINIVQDVCVFVSESTPHALFAYIKLTDNSKIDNIAAKELILTQLQNNLPSYCIPSYLKISNDLPLNPNGKIDRKLIQQYFNVLEA